MSLLWLPRSLVGVVWAPVEVDWPGPQGLSSDLERVGFAEQPVEIENAEG